MNAQSAGATDASEEVPQAQAEGKVESQETRPTLLEAVNAELGVKSEEKPKEEVKAAPESDAEPAKTTDPEAEPEGENGETAEAPPEKPTAEKDAEKPPPDEWPESAKARVKEEADKRRARTVELEKVTSIAKQWQSKALQTEQQLQVLANRQSAPRPTPKDPLADIVDEGGLLEAENQARVLLKFAKTHRDGVEDFVTGKDAAGNEVRETFTPEQIVEMELSAEDVLQRAIPRKAAYLQQTRACSEEAQKRYPEMFNPDTQDSKDAAMLLQAIPELRRFPDYPILIGQFILGRKTEAAALNGKNGDPKTGVSEAARKILAAPKAKPAPTPPKTRAAEGPVANVDIETARKHLKEGKPGSMEEFVGATLSKGRCSTERDLVNA